MNKRKVSGMENAVELIHVSKSFRKEDVLKDITHSFETGKIHGIIGFNGSGKTVLFKCICGFLYPESGYVKVWGEHIGKDIDFPKSLGMIIETPGFRPYLTGYKNLKYLAEIRNKVGKEKIEEVMLHLGLDPHSKKKVRQYSLGMRERLGIAQAIMENPDLIVLDEPFNGLDKNGVTEVCRIFRELKERGKTILLAAHNMPDGLCDTICEMDAGVLTQTE